MSTRTHGRQAGPPSEGSARGDAEVLRKRLGWLALHAQHSSIVASLQDRDRDASRRLMREHILYVHAYMFGE
jgi:DNA-binding GntR family transcriptional regulator